MPRVEFLEKVWGPGPGDVDAVYKRSGRRYRVGQVEDFEDEAFAVLVRDIDPKAFRVVGEDQALRARKAETLVENQARSLSQMDMEGHKTEAKHLARKMTPEYQEAAGIAPEATPEEEPEEEPKPRVKKVKTKPASRETTGGKSVKDLRAEILGA